MDLTHLDNDKLVIRELIAEQTKVITTNRRAHSRRSPRQQAAGAVREAKLYARLAAARQAFKNIYGYEAP